MARFNMTDFSINGEVVNVDKSVSLNLVFDSSDWSDDEIEQIAGLDIGQAIIFDGIAVERVE